MFLKMNMMMATILKEGVNGLNGALPSRYVHPTIFWNL
jgi:hypothetical protein